MYCISYYIMQQNIISIHIAFISISCNQKMYVILINVVDMQNHNNIRKELWG
jgi:hypothetical protein